ncbi:MAG: DUF4439 domain-containing protein [Promicromonosporaceae bacterium]|nr:DUF4439 domain-containing protein [Promicromonosporaceae bacterium]
MSRRLARTFAALCALAVGVSLLGGCRLRLETAPASEPVPDVAEMLRRTAVYDALEVTEAAQSALGRYVQRAPMVAELEQIIAFSAAHVEALGGVYVSGVEPEPDLLAPGAEPYPTPAMATATDVIGALNDAASRNRTAANNAADAGMARLLTSISASQELSATRLAALARLELPHRPPVQIPEPLPTEAPVEEEDLAAAQAAATAEEADEVDPVPGGLSPGDFVPLVISEDSIRWALEVLAASMPVEERADVLRQADHHGRRAAAWARLGGLAGTPGDPRALAYQVPRYLEADELVLVGASTMIENYTTLVSRSEPGSRLLFIDLLSEAVHTADGLGHPPHPFPGMPELADGLPAEAP